MIASQLLRCSRAAWPVAGLAVKLGLAEAYEVWTMDGGEGVIGALAVEAGRLG